MTKPRIQVTLSSDEHAGMLSEFFRSAWGSTATPAQVVEARRAAAAANPVEPGIVPPSVVAHDGERILAYIGSLPMPLWTGAVEIRSYWAKGLMVLPEHRNGPLGAAVLKEFVRHVPRSGALIGATAAHRLFMAIGYRDGGGLPNHLRILNGWRIASRTDIGLVAGVPRPLRGLIKVLRSLRLAGPLGALLALAMRGVGVVGVARTAWAGLRGDEERPSGEEVESLWIRTRTGLGIAVRRDGDMWSTRYGPTRGVEAGYTNVAIRRKGALVGIASVRMPQEQAGERLRGLRIAVVSDALFERRDTAAAVALVGAAVAAARRCGADALLCSTTVAPITKALRSQAFLPIGANLRFVFRSPSTDQPMLPAAGCDWWLLRGDGESDGIF